jgi:hypothetical protein
LGEDACCGVAGAFFGGYVVGWVRRVLAGWLVKKGRVGRGRTSAVGAEEEFAVAGDDGVEEGAAVLGGLGGGFAVVVLDC